MGIYIGGILQEENIVNYNIKHCFLQIYFTDDDMDMLTRCYAFEHERK
jgi:hypothetical protein